LSSELHFTYKRHFRHTWIYSQRECRVN